MAYLEEPRETFLRAPQGHHEHSVNLRFIERGVSDRESDGFGAAVGGTGSLECQAHF